MKKILLVLPVIILMAAGCSASSTQTQSTNQQETPSAPATAQDQINEGIRGPANTNTTPNIPPAQQIAQPKPTQVSPPPTTQTPAQTSPAQNNNTASFPRLASAQESQRFDHFIQIYITAWKNKDAQTLVNVFDYPSDYGQNSSDFKDSQGYWNFSSYNLYKAIVTNQDYTGTELEAYYTVPDKTDASKFNIVIVSGNYATSEEKSTLHQWQVFPSATSPHQYSSQTDINKELDVLVNSILK